MPPAAMAILATGIAMHNGRALRCGYFGKHQQVIVTEALRGFPLLAVLVEAGEGDVVPRAAFGFILPNRSLDAADADFSDGLWVSHDVFPPKKLRVCERFRSPVNGGNANQAHSRIFELQQEDEPQAES